MGDFFGYVSSFFMTFGLGIGFGLGGLIFISLIAYGLTLLFKRSRLAMREKDPQPYLGVRNKLVPSKSKRERRGPTPSPGL
jgi:Ca2+/Na+ antiporter